MDMLFTLKFPDLTVGQGNKPIFHSLVTPPLHKKFLRIRGARNDPIPLLMWCTPLLSCLHLNLLLPKTHICQDVHHLPSPFRCPQPFSSCSLPSTLLRNRFPGQGEEKKEVLATGQLAGHAKAKQTDILWREEEVPAES